MTELAGHEITTRAAAIHRRLVALGIDETELDPRVIEILLCIASGETCATTGRRYGVVMSAGRRMRREAVDTLRRAIRLLPTKAHTGVVLDWIEEQLGPVIKKRLGLGYETEVLEPNNVERIGLLGVRTMNCLHNFGVETIEDLLQCTEKELLHVNNFGPMCLREVKARLKKRGLSLATVAMRCNCRYRVYQGQHCPVHGERRKEEAGYPPFGGGR